MRLSLILLVAILPFLAFARYDRDIAFNVPDQIHGRGAACDGWYESYTWALGGGAGATYENCGGGCSCESEHISFRICNVNGTCSANGDGQIYAHGTLIQLKALRRSNGSFEISATDLYQLACPNFPVFSTFDDVCADSGICQVILEGWDGSEWDSTPVMDFTNYSATCPPMYVLQSHFRNNTACNATLTPINIPATLNFVCTVTAMSSYGALGGIASMNGSANGSSALAFYFIPGIDMPNTSTIRGTARCNLTDGTSLTVYREGCFGGGSDPENNPCWQAIINGDVCIDCRDNGGNNWIWSLGQNESYRIADVYGNIDQVTTSPGIIYANERLTTIRNRVVSEFGRMNYNGVKSQYYSFTLPEQCTMPDPNFTVNFESGTLWQNRPGQPYSFGSEPINGVYTATLGTNYISCTSSAVIYLTVQASRNVGDAATNYIAKSENIPIYIRAPTYTIDNFQFFMTPTGKSDFWAGISHSYTRSPVPDGENITCEIDANGTVTAGIIFQDRLTTTGMPGFTHVWFPAQVENATVVSMLPGGFPATITCNSTGGPSPTPTPTPMDISASLTSTFTIPANHLVRVFQCNRRPNSLYEDAWVSNYPINDPSILTPSNYYCYIEANDSELIGRFNDTSGDFTQIGYGQYAIGLGVTWNAPDYSANSYYAMTNYGTIYAQPHNIAIVQTRNPVELLASERDQVFSEKNESARQAIFMLYDLNSGNYNYSTWGALDLQFHPFVEFGASNPSFRIIAKADNASNFTGAVEPGDSVRCSVSVRGVQTDSISATMAIYAVNGYQTTTCNSGTSSEQPDVGITDANGTSGATYEFTRTINGVGTNQYCNSSSFRDAMNDSAILYCVAQITYIDTNGAPHVVATDPAALPMRMNRYGPGGPGNNAAPDALLCIAGSLLDFGKGVVNLFLTDTTTAIAIVVIGCVLLIISIFLLILTRRG